MKKFLNTVSDIWKIQDLKKRIIYTLFFILMYRVGSYIALPGIDTNLLMNNDEGRGILGLINMFAGGAFSRASIFALGVMPYISASIIMQLLSITIPFFQKLQREGESGKRYINKATRLLTILITVVQASVYIKSMISPEAILVNHLLFNISSIIFIAAGTMFVVWLGEKITDKGIGNGISIIIMIGIIARLPGSLTSEIYYRINAPGGMVIFLIELMCMVVLIMLVIYLIRATRNIPISYAKQYLGGSSNIGAARQYIPLKVNSAGVMPIIFAQAFMFIPTAMASMFKDSANNAFFMAFRDYGSFTYNSIFSLLIILFTFLYTAVAINSNTMADNMKKNNSFIPGVKPGKATAHYIDNILSRMTLFGAVYLAFIAFIPAIAIYLGVDRNFAQFFGGTSLIIMVSVIIDTKQQINSYLLFNRYDKMSGSVRFKNLGFIR
ncbi:MAG: preprotein translocase subunit SecY [Solitalea-like symbiont of Acarus siro]